MIYYSVRYFPDSHAPHFSSYDWLLSELNLHRYLKHWVASYADKDPDLVLRLQRQLPFKQRSQP